jgi:nitrogen fixation/metabolism regulation signal transduction histidine kinase
MRLSIQYALKMKKNNTPGWQEKIDTVAKSLLEQIDVLSNIASEFSNFAHVNEQRREPVNLSEILHKVIELFSVYNNIKFDINENTTDQKLIIANNDQLQRVFTNLIKNAVQAVENKENANVSVTLNETEGNYTILIEDNGNGIPSEAQDRLFQPNFTTKSGGTGLGLAISKSIVESFGGNISFENRQNGGACFSVQFPITNIGLELLTDI